MWYEPVQKPKASADFLYRTIHSGPEMNQLAESLEAAFGNQMQPPEEVQVPQPIRPNDLPELFSPPTQSTLMGGGGQDNQNPALNLSPWDHPQLPQPPPWTRPARGPNHEQNQRLINRLSDVRLEISLSFVHPLFLSS